jgi:cytochrome c biogenesis protein CcdA
MIDATTAAYALLLGAVAAFNPCGFALLPAYITVIVTGSADGEVPRTEALSRAALFGLAMTLGFVAVFTGLGLLFGGVNAALQGSILPYLPYVTLVLGVALVVLGFVMLIKGEMRGPGLRFRGRAPSTSFASQVVYGAGFALASLSCTIAPFFAVVTASLAASNPAGAVAPFVIYAVGMGTAVLAVSLAAAFAGASVGAALRRHTPLIMRIGGAIMILAGLYVVTYGLAELLPQFGVRALDPVLLGTSRWQGQVSDAVAGLGAPVLGVIAGVVAVAVAATLVAARRRRRSSEAD